MKKIIKETLLGILSCCVGGLCIASGILWIFDGVNEFKR